MTIDGENELLMWMSEQWEGQDRSKINGKEFHQMFGDLKKIGCWIFWRPPFRSFASNKLPMLIPFQAPALIRSQFFFTFFYIFVLNIIFFNPRYTSSWFWLVIEEDFPPPPQKKSIPYSGHNFFLLFIKIQCIPVVRNTKTIRFQTYSKHCKRYKLYSQFLGGSIPGMTEGGATGATRLGSSAVTGPTPATTGSNTDPAPAQARRRCRRRRCRRRR